MSNSTLMNAAIMAFLSFQFEIHLPLIMQIVMTPASMLTDPLVARYVRGKEEVGLYDETLEMPAGAVVEKAAGAAEGDEAKAVEAPKEAQQQQLKKGRRGKLNAPEANTPATRATVELQKLVDTTWSGDATTDVLAVEALAESGADVNVSVEAEGWTILMVSSGLRRNGADVIRRLIALGCDRLQKDGEGWTALHWAAHNNSLHAAKALLEDLDAASQFELLGSTSNDSQVAVEVAIASKKSAEVAVYLGDLMKSVSESAPVRDDAEEEEEEEKEAVSAPSTEDVSAVRQQKRAQMASIPDID